MRNADGGVRGVYVLPAFARGAVGIDTQILLVDIDLDRVIDFRIDGDGRKRRMSTLCRIERRDANEPMYTGFGKHHSVGEVAADDEGRGFDAGLFTSLNFEDSGLVAALLRPSEIHAHQHFRPVLGLGAAGAGMDVDDGIQPIVFAGEKQLRFNLLNKGARFGKGGFQLRFDGLAFACEVHESLGIIDLS